MSHVTDADDGVHVYLQSSDRVVQLEQMLDRLDETYSPCDDDRADETATYRPGDAVAVCVGTIWQRAMVLCDTVGADTTVRVQCVDCGSVHDIDVGKVRRLNAELTSEPMFAFECRLVGVTADAGMSLRHCFKFPLET